MRKFISHFLIYGSAPFIAKFSALVTAPILTFALTVKDFGILEVLSSVLSMLVLFVAMNLNSGLFRFFYENDNEDERKNLFSTVFFIYVLFSIIVVVIGVALSSTLSVFFLGYEEKSLFTLALIKIPFVLIYELNLSLIRLLQKARLYVALYMALAFFNVFGVVFLYLSSSISIYNILLLQFVNHCLLTSISIVINKKYIGLYIKKYCLLDLSRYSIPQIPSVIANFIIMGSMPILITQFSSLTDSGYYAIAFKVASIFAFFLQAFRMVYGPIQMKAMALGAAQFSQVNRSALLFLSSFLFLLAIYSIYISKLIFLFFIDEKFNFAQTIIFPLCMALFLSALNNIILGAISYVKKTIYMSISQLVSLFLFIVLVRPVIVNFGFQGAAYLLLFSTVLQCCVSYLFAQKLFRIDYNIWPVIVSVVSVFVFLSFYKVGLFYYLDVFLFFSCFMFFIYRSKFLTKIKKYI